MTTPRKSNMAADEDLPKLGSVPPEEEYEVTRIGTRDEIQRALEDHALEDHEGAHANNLPTPPVPPPTEQMRHALAGDPIARLAPPPADLVRERGNEVPTKPPTAGLVSDSDIDTAFLDPSLESRLEELESEVAKPTRQVLDAPVFPHAPPLPGAKSKAEAARKVAPSAEVAEDEVDESRRIQAPTDIAEPEVIAESDVIAELDATPNKDLVRAPSVAGRQVLIVAVTIVLLVILAMLRR
jgi:hypothetical protein